MTKNIKLIKLKLFLSALIISASAANIAQANDELYKNKPFSVGIRGEISKSDFSFDTPAGNSILKWENMRGRGVGIDLGYKFNDTIEAFGSYTSSTSNGKGTDDDITNSLEYDASLYTPKPNELGNKEIFLPLSAYSIHKAKAKSKDLRVGLNIKLFNNASTKISGRLGYFNKKLTQELNSGKQLVSYLYYRPYQVLSTLGATRSINGLAAKTDSNFSGAIVGFKIDKSFNNDSINSLIVDFYPSVAYDGDQFWPQRESQSQRWSLNNANNKNYGLFVQASHEFKINESLWFKLYANYENIHISKLKESGYKFNIKGGDKDSATKGNTKYENIVAGIGLSF